MEPDIVKEFMEILMLTMSGGMAMMTMVYAFVTILDIRQNWTKLAYVLIFDIILMWMLDIGFVEFFTTIFVPIYSYTIIPDLQGTNKIVLALTMMIFLFMIIIEIPPILRKFNIVTLGKFAFIIPESMRESETPNVSEISEESNMKNNTTIDS